MDEIEVEEIRFNSGAGEKEGDIYASLCLDKIPEQKVINPFRCKGMLMIATNFPYPKEGPKTAVAYRLLPEAEFEEESTTYQEKISIDGGYTARGDPNGFYHGMRVQHARTKYVMVGPKISLTGRKTPPQGDLFG